MLDIIFLGITKMPPVLKYAKNLIKNPLLIFPYVGHFGLLNWLPDATYLKGCFRAYLGYKLDLENPKTFNEKLQWLKLYDRNPAYTQMVDKYAVREYIKNTIGEEYLIPLLGVWDSFDEIDFDELPNQFVLKTNHDSGTVVICKDKKTFDIDAARKKINKRINYNYYYPGREWPYKNVKPKIIAEKFMVDESGYELKDYKFFAFNGEIKALYVATDRQSGIATFDFFDLEFNHLPIKTHGHPNSNNKLSQPRGFYEMVELAQKLSEGIPHVRVDFYDINGDVYFGEMTFYHMCGLTPITPIEWDYTLGSWIQLPQKTE